MTNSKKSCDDIQMHKMKKTSWKCDLSAFRGNYERPIDRPTNQQTYILLIAKAITLTCEVTYHNNKGHFNDNYLIGSISWPIQVS